MSCIGSPKEIFSYLDVERFRHALRLGARRVVENVNKLNRINVFPVQDGDTGTNLTLTLERALHRATDTYGGVGSFVKKLSESLLIEAKGNSGVLLSQFFLGFAEALGENVKVSVHEFSEAFKRAVRATYDAIENPKEGTILTVMRAASDGMAEGIGEGRDFVEAMERALRMARKALRDTPKYLPILKEKGVVDAGGLGFTLLLEGFVEGLKGKDYEEEDTARPIPRLQRSGHQSAVDSRYTFCTEALLRGKELRKERVKEILRDLGDSILVAGDESVIHIHIHTDRPSEVFDRVLSFGSLEERKVDRMKPPCLNPPGRVAVLTDTTCDLPDDIINSYGICVVPLTVIIGEESFKDGVEVSRKEIIEILSDDRINVSTSQPSIDEYVTFIEEALKNAEEVIIVSLSKGLSGTFQSALSAAKIVGDGKVRVFDSMAASIGEGLLALRAAELSREGYSLLEIYERLERLREELIFYFTFRDFHYIVRSGRISWSQGKIAQLLNIRPILILEHGKEIKRVSQSFGEKRLIDKLVKLLRRRVKPNMRYDVGVAHALVPGIPEILKERLKKFIQIRHFIMNVVTPVLSIHAGPGAWGVFLLPIDEKNNFISQ